MIYYIDNISGNTTNDGLTPETAVASYKNVNISAGDTVLFRRGCVFREQLKATDGIVDCPTTYGAYGEGDKPTFSFAFMLDDKNLWQEHSKNIWQFMGIIPSEVGNIFFDGGWGILCYDYSELKSQGDWYYTHIGYTVKPEKFSDEQRGTPKVLYMYSVGNPTEVYCDLKAALIGDMYLSYAEHNVVFENLCFEYGAIHGFESYNGSNIAFRGCDYRYIGGAVWDRDLRIRFGNGIEFWTYCENVLVENCTFYEIYDSCFTHQGAGEYETPKNIRVIGNHFSNYGMAAYELRDKITYNTYFSGNTCENAGVGMCIDYTEGPRRSEIYPQPMGHHIFIWRIDAPTPDGCVKISNNTFRDAPCGSAIYSIINTQAEKQLIFKDNIFDEDKDELIKMGGKYYSLNEFNQRIMNNL